MGACEEGPHFTRTGPPRLPADQEDNTQLVVTIPLAPLERPTCSSCPRFHAEVSFDVFKAKSKLKKELKTLAWASELPGVLSGAGQD